MLLSREIQQQKTNGKLVYIVIWQLQLSYMLCTTVP